MSAVEAIEHHLHPHFRRALVYAVIAVVAYAVGRGLGGVRTHQTSHQYAAIALAVVFLVFGVMAVRAAANEAARVASFRGGAATATTIRLAVSVVGYLLVVLATLDMLDVSLKRLLIGGAITGVVVGIAAQQSLGNLAAGLVVLISRPFTVGESVRVHSGGMGGPFDGIITSIGLVYTTIETEEGPVSLPNSGLLGAAVGRIPKEYPTGIEHPESAARRAGRHTLLG